MLVIQKVRINIWQFYFYLIVKLYFPSVRVIFIKIYREQGKFNI